MDENEIWKQFLSRPIGSSLPLRLRWLVRSREPLRHRTPTVCLYEGLALLHQGIISRSELENNIDANEAVDRSLALKIDKVWKQFLARRVAKELSPVMLERVRSRAPLPHVPPTVALFEALAAYHLGVLSFEDLESTAMFNDELDRELAGHRGSTRPRLHLVRGGARTPGRSTR